MNVEGLGFGPKSSEPQFFTGTRPAVQLTLATISRRSYVHLVIGGEALLLDENHATALARILDGCVAEIQARAVSL